MRKNFLIYQIIFSFFILSFPSCINQDFDLDDEKLDTNVTLGDGINLPIGDIEKISIYDELLKVYDALKIREVDSVLYVEYGGTFPVEFPAFEIPTPGNKIEATTNINLPSLLEGNIPADLLPLSLFLDQSESYEISRPGLGETNGLQIDPKKVGFKSFVLGVKFKLTGLEFPGATEDAKLVVSVKFSKHYGIKDANSDNEIIIPILISELKLNNYETGTIEVDSYSFEEEGESGLTYKVTLESENAIQVSATSPKFTFILDPGEGELSVSYLECSLNGEKEFSGEENGFGDLQGAFGDGDILAFRDPSLTLDLTTNLGADFKLGLDLNAGSDDKHAFLDNLLSFEKSADGSTKTESYLLTPEELKNFDSIISTPFPEKLDYTVKLIFNDQKARLLPSDQLELSADYSFKIPFDFKEISLSLKDTVADLFSEDTYEQIFSHIDDVSIVADLDLNIGGGGIELVVDAAILDSDKNKIPGLVDVSRDGNTLLIAIKDDEGEEMKKARHLELTFWLSGGGAIKESDYIKINKLRLVSSSGIHYEF